MYLAAVRLYWKTFVLVTCAVLAVGLTSLLLAPIQYVSTTQLLVSINGSTTATAYQNDDVVTGRVNSYIALLTSDVVSQRVIDKLRLPLTPAEFAAKVSATKVPPKTSIIDVAVTDDSPAKARQLANTVAEEFISYADALEIPTGEDGQKVHTTVVSTASEPHSRLAERIALGALVGLAALVLGCVAVWIRSLTDTVVRTADRAASAAGVPVLGYVTAAAAASLDHLDGYRRLRARLKSTVSTGEAHVSMLASAVGEVDAALVASNLGRVMELSGSHSVVLHADTAASLTHSSSAPEDEGRSHSDDDESPAQSASASESPDSTHAATACGAQPEELVSVQVAQNLPPSRSAARHRRRNDLQTQAAAATLIKQLRGEYGELVISAPPVLSTFTASALSEYADAVLLLVAAETTKRQDIALASERLTAVGAPLVGLVFVGDDDNRGTFQGQSRAQVLHSQRSADASQVRTETSERN